MILLDTNAIIWMVTNHRRGRRLQRSENLSISPASVLELGMMVSVGRIRMRLQDVIEDDRWVVDDPVASLWFTRAGEESWTRDPFDRLIVAHARLRGWQLATGDAQMLDHLRPSEAREL
ncbi:MAG: type II toxin-antitoxin system VapC family toxin [Vicinamibacterales bacterium]